MEVQVANGHKILPLCKLISYLEKEYNKKIKNKYIYIAYLTHKYCIKFLMKN